MSDTNSSADANAGKLNRFQSIDKIVAGGLEAFAGDFVKKVLCKSTPESKPLIPAFTESMILATRENTICATQLALASRTDTTSFLNKVEVPALIIRGENDLLMNKEQAQVLKLNLQDSRFVEIADSGHLPNLENPVEFNAALNLFLQQRFSA